VLSPPSHLPHTPLDNEDSSRTQQDAIKLIPELTGKVVEGQWLVSEEEACNHKDVGKDDHQH